MGKCQRQKLPSSSMRAVCWASPAISSRSYGRQHGQCWKQPSHWQKSLLVKMPPWWDWLHSRSLVVLSGTLGRWSLICRSTSRFPNRVQRKNSTIVLKAGWLDNVRKSGMRRVSRFVWTSSRDWETNTVFFRSSTQIVTRSQQLMIGSHRRNPRWLDASSTVLLAAMIKFIFGLCVLGAWLPSRIFLGSQST